MHHIPVHDLWWLAASGVSYGARYVRRKVVRYRTLVRRSRLPDPTPELLRLQAEFGYSEHSLVSITPGAMTWTMREIPGAIVYSEFGRVWLAAADPLVSSVNLPILCENFLQAAHERHRIVAFVPTTERFAAAAVKLGMSAMKIGAAPYFDLSEWNPRGNAAKKMRSGVNQATRAGVQIKLVETIDTDFRQEAAELCLSWLQSRPAATTFGWLLALDPFLHAEHKQLVAARDGAGRLIGLVAASPIPARKGWYIEDVLRAPDAPQGTADLLVVSTLQHLKSVGAELATLGTAPLASEGDDTISTRDHILFLRALQTVSRRFSTFYNFEGIRIFKAKFVPTRWESEYVLIQRGAMMPPRVAHAMLRAIVPGGLKQLLARKALRKLKSELSPDSDQERD